MPHTPEEKQRVLARVRRVRGQAQALERALEDGAECAAVLQRNAPRRDQPYNTMQLMQWNWFLDRGVLAFDPATKHLRIDYAKYPAAVEALLREVLALQAAGDRSKAEAFIDTWTTWDPALHEPVSQAIRAALPYRYSLYRYAALGE